MISRARNQFMCIFRMRMFAKSVRYRRRLAVATAIGASLTGCLPEPPAYDPCADETSQYFSVAPKGCNGHELTTLWEDRHLEQFPEVLSLPPTLVVGRDEVFWSDGTGRIRRTNDNDDTSVVLYESTAHATAVADFDPSSHRLYILLLHLDDDSNRVSSQIVGVDVETGESRVLVELADIAINGLRAIGGRFYFTLWNTGADSPLLTAPLAWDSTSTTRDIQSCVPSELMSKRLVIGLSAAHYLDSDPSSIVSIDLARCSAVAILPVGALGSDQTTLVAAGDELYLQDCDTSAFDCTFSRVDADGNRQLIARGYFSWINSPVVRDRDVYVVSNRLGNEMAEPPRLYTWKDDMQAPLAIAAPLLGWVRLALSAKYVYAIESTGGLSAGILESAEYASVSRILRMRR